MELTLEQTINAYAASSMTGLIHLTNTISARQRWAVSHSIRTKIVSELLQFIDLGKSENFDRNLSKTKLKKKQLP